ncbi:hypothetical protein TorRG33x02_255500 [Trema orientale]|uniref:Uncharacterized protein n=1 Tax=Trema orientale TaxID=63057 RepID=A0A2P5DCP7_TREOI|nr:hypothetical protein TorRG33x02_255500 [Trema orientale]
MKISGLCLRFIYQLGLPVTLGREGILFGQDYRLQPIKLPHGIIKENIDAYILDELANLGVVAKKSMIFMPKINDLLVDERVGRCTSFGLMKRHKENIYKYL